MKSSEPAMFSELDTDIALCLNVGSSSLKFALFRVSDTSEERLALGAVERGGASISDSLNAVFESLHEKRLPQVTVVGHRVVHGGPAHVRHALIDATLREDLKTLIPLAPLHLPEALLCIDGAIARLPSVPQVACFDTAFHASMPEHAKRFPLPAHFYDEGIRRYGFHGLSYEYVVSTLGSPPPPRVIVAHLGNGASIAAVENGRSVDTTMGFTPESGIMMGTRAGDLDPGLLIYLLRERGYSPSTLESLVDREAGLLGVAGTADMKELTERRKQDERARLAIAMFGYAVRKTIGAYVAVLGGLDVLVFTGGIGENAPAIREEACRGLSSLGITLDLAKNARNGAAIHAEGSACSVLVVNTDEDRMIARHARAVVRH